MKKTALLISFFMIPYFCFADKGYGQAEQTDLKIISLSGNDKHVMKSLSDSKIKSLFSAVQETFQTDGSSNDYDKLKPLIGKKWLMAYEVQSSVYTDILIFTSVITIVPDSDDIFSLCVLSQENREGCVFYVNSKNRGPGFALALDGTQLDLYFFTLNGDVAKGVCYKDNKEQDLTGIRWGGEIKGCDVNCDNKIGLAEVIDHLKIISGLKSFSDSSPCSE